MKLKYFEIFLKYKGTHLKNMGKQKQNKQKTTTTTTTKTSDQKVIRYKNFPWKFRVLENSTSAFLSIWT